MFPGPFGVERAVNRAIGTDTFGNLDDMVMEHLRETHAAVEDVGAMLIADAQLVGEALGDGQYRRLAGMFQQRIRGHRRAHAHGVDPLRRNRVGWCEFEYRADAVDGCVVVLFRILREELARYQCAVRGARNDVGKRAAAVDPELPVRKGSGRGLRITRHGCRIRGLVVVRRAPRGHRR